MAARREVSIQNQEGLHFRPIMQFVDLASKYRSRITVQCEDRKADARSPMELLMLVATKGTLLEIEAVGEDENDVVEALAALVLSGFDEPK